MFSPHSKLNLIGIAAPAQSGKSTLARILREAHNYVEDSFAAPIRTMVASICGLTLEQMEVVKEDVIPWIGQSPRQMMQSLGTEWGRNMVHRDLWVESCFQRVQRLHDAGRHVVISDVRFDNEAETIRSMGGTVVHITRPDGRRTVADHMSEVGITRHPNDKLFINDGSIQDLADAVDFWHYSTWASAR